MSARAGGCDARDHPEGLHLVPADRSGWNGFRAILPRDDGGAVCNDCGDLIAGAVFVIGRCYLCGPCIAEDLPTLVRAPEPVRECAWCGRAIVIVSRDGRVRLDVCSQWCRDARREAERRPVYEPRTCEYTDCMRTFTPSRPDQRFCPGNTCRVRAHKERRQ